MDIIYDCQCDGLTDNKMKTSIQVEKSTMCSLIRFVDYNAQAVCDESRLYGFYGGKIRENLPIQKDPLLLYC